MSSQAAGAKVTPLGEQGWRPRRGAEKHMIFRLRTLLIRLRLHATPAALAKECHDASKRRECNVAGSLRDPERPHV